jgi:alanine dehydrogenase
VTIIDLSAKRLRELDDLFEGKVNIIMSNSKNIETAVINSDLVIGAVLIPGAKAPKLISEDMVKKMKKGSAIVDIAIDQGGIVETVDRITTHDNPSFEKHGVIHYSVANMPGAVPRTSTYALTNVTLPYAIQIANHGIVKACAKDRALKLGVNTVAGKLTYEAVAEAFGKEFRNVDELLPLAQVKADFSKLKLENKLSTTQPA